MENRELEGICMYSWMVGFGTVSSTCTNLRYSMIFRNQNLI